MQVSYVAGLYVKRANFGHVAAARCMLEHGADPNEAQLHWAAAAGHADLVEVLIAAGARVDGHDAGGRTPLAYVEHPAWKHVGHTDVARVLRRASSLSKRRRKQPPSRPPVSNAAGSSCDRLATPPRVASDEVL